MLTRSDYMIQTNQDDDKTQLSLKQVEFNTISIGCAGVASIIPSLHRLVAVNSLPSLYDILNSLSTHMLSP